MGGGAPVPVEADLLGAGALREEAAPDVRVDVRGKCVRLADPAGGGGVWRQPLDHVGCCARVRPDGFGLSISWMMYSSCAVFVTSTPIITVFAHCLTTHMAESGPSHLGYL